MQKSALNTILHYTTLQCRVPWPCLPAEVCWQPYIPPPRSSSSSHQFVAPCHTIAHCSAGISLYICTVPCTLLLWRTSCTSVQCPVHYYCGELASWGVFALPVATGHWPLATGTRAPTDWLNFTQKHLLGKEYSLFSTMNIFFCTRISFDVREVQ